MLDAPDILHEEEPEYERVEVRNPLAKEDRERLKKNIKALCNAFQ